MQKELIISTTPQETKLAILEDDELVEIYIEWDKEHGIVGGICKGKVTKVLPGMQSAFVDIGLERDAFLYVSDFFEDTEEYDKIVSTVEDEVTVMQDTAARPAAPPPPAPAPLVPAPLVPAPLVLAPPVPAPLETSVEETVSASEETRTQTAVPAPQAFDDSLDPRGPRRRD